MMFGGWGPAAQRKTGEIRRLVATRTGAGLLQSGAVMTPPKVRSPADSTGVPRRRRDAVASPLCRTPNRYCHCDEPQHPVGAVLDGIGPGQQRNICRIRIEKAEAGHALVLGQGRSWVAPRLIGGCHHQWRGGFDVNMDDGLSTSHHSRTVADGEGPSISTCPSRSTSSCGRRVH